MVNPEYIKRVLQGMTEVLKPARFRKKGSVFAADREDVIFFVGLYKDVGRTLDEVAVQIYIGAYSRPLAQASADRSGPGPSIYNQPPTCVDDCHWSRGWAGNRAMIATREDAERVAEEVARYLREFALPEFEKLTPAAKLHDVLYAGHGGGNALYKTCEEVLREWAVAEGKTTDLARWLVTKENPTPVGCG